LPGEVSDKQELPEKIQEKLKGSYYRTDGEDTQAISTSDGDHISQETSDDDNMTQETQETPLENTQETHQETVQETHQETTQENHQETTQETPQRAPQEVQFEAPQSLQMAMSVFIHNVFLANPYFNSIVKGEDRFFYMQI
jgi:hypothetical protein